MPAQTSDTRRYAVLGDGLADRNDPLFGTDHDMVTNPRRLALVNMHPSRVLAMVPARSRLHQAPPARVS